MLVPDSSNSPCCPCPPTSLCGKRRASVLPGAYSECSRRPGAAMSGLTIRSYSVGPRELKSATVSSLRRAVPCPSSAPTVSAYGELPGEVIPPSTSRPSSVRP